MMDDEKFSDLKRVKSDAQRAYYSLKGEISSAINAEEARIKGEFAERLTAAIQLVNAAETALENHQKELAQRASESFVAEKYYEVKYRQYSDKIIGKTGRVGITEVITGDSVHPGNKTFGRADLGEVVLRLMKKDGKPSAHYVRSGWGGVFSGWKKDIAA